MATASTFTLSADTVVMGSPVTISIQKGAANYRHTLTYEFWGNTQHTAQRIAVQTAAETLTWVPDTELLAPLLPNASQCGRQGESTWCRIQMITYDGDSVVGEQNAYIVLKVPESAVPVVDPAALVITKVNNNQVVAGWDVWLQGYTSLSMTADHEYITEAYGSAIRSGRMVCDGETDTSTPYTRSTFGTSGAKTVSFTVTDYRGRESAAAEQRFTVLPYFRPYASGVSAFRCNDQGVAADDGTCLYASGTPVCASVDGHNSAEVKLYYKAHGSSTWSAAFDVSAAGGIVVGIALSATTAYDVKLVTTDALGEGVALEFLIGTRTVAWHAKAGGKSFAIGMMASSLPDENFVCAWPAGFLDDMIVGGDLTLNGDMFLGQNRMTDYVIGQYETNNYSWRKWASGISEFWGRAVINNEPCLTQPWSGVPFYVSASIDSGMTFPDGLFVTGSGLKMQISWARSAGTPAIVWNDGSQGTTAPCTIKLARMNPAYLTGRIHYFFQGRWK